MRVRRVQTCIARRVKDLNTRHLQHWRVWDACNTAFILRKCFCVVWGPFGVRRGVLGGEAGLALIIDCLLNYLSPVWANWGWIKETSVNPCQVEGWKCVSVTLYVLKQKMINTPEYVWKQRSHVAWPPFPLDRFISLLNSPNYVIFKCKNRPAPPVS